MSLQELCQWIQDTQVGTAIRESIWVFPIIETTHVIGLAVSVGLILWFDLRTLGFILRQQPVSQVYRAIKPVMAIGFFVMFATGALLFWASAARAYESLYFRIKFASMFLAGVNALYFHFVTQRNMGEWDKSPVPPFQVRMAGLLSLVLWSVVIATGRLMAYTY